MNAFHFGKLVLYSQIFEHPPLPTSSFAEQTIIVTGSNTGIGYETVKHFIRLHAAKVIVAVRSVSKGESAVRRIVEEIKCDASRLEVWEFDLTKYESIRAFVARANGLERLDVVVQNAGIATPTKWTEDEDGTEITVKVDALCPAYFAYAILPKLRESAEKTGLTGRLSLNGSDAMFYATIASLDVPGSLLDALRDPAQHKKLGERYGLAKALLFWSIRSLTEKSPLVTGPGSKSNVLINVVTPGATKSEFFSREERPWIVNAIVKVLSNLLARETEVGARTLVHAVEPSLDAKAHGQFLMNSKIMFNNPMFGTPKMDAFQRRWEKEFLPYLEKIQPGVTDI